jgi:hypothetical protein
LGNTSFEAGAVFGFSTHRKDDFETMLNIAPLKKLGRLAEIKGQGSFVQCFPVRFGDEGGKTDCSSSVA